MKDQKFIMSRLKYLALYKYKYPNPYGEYGIMNLHTERYGHGKKIIFIHGSGWNTGMWHNQVNYLKSSMEVMLVDMPGHGLSTGEGCSSVEEYMESVYSVIKEYNIKDCYLAGHSLGGAVTLSMALSHPEVLSGIVLAGTGAKLRVLPEILEGIARDKAAAVSNIAKLAFSKSALPALLKWDFEEMMKCEAKVMYKDFYACDHFNIMDTVNLLKIPALIICGTHDLLTPPKYSAYLNGQITNSTIVLIKNAGHMVMMEKPVEVNKAIADFVLNGRLF